MPPNMEECSKDELNTLQWLDNEFFTRVLQHCEQEIDAQLEVKSVQLSQATKKIDHLASVIFRAVIDYQQAGISRSKAIIIKTMPEFDDYSYKKTLVGESFIFETEIGMYTEVLPRFERILRSIGDGTMLKANCLYNSLSPRKLIICEDLEAKGYRTIDERPITLEVAKCAYMKLAKWHAISHKLIIEDPKYFDQYRHSFVSMPNIMEYEFMTSSITNFTELLGSLSTLRQYVPYFDALKDDLFKNIIDSFNEYREAPQDRVFYVLCHGDFNYKNIMVKHNEITGELQDVMLLDFQLSYVGNIASDILYSFFMLCDADMRTHYHEVLYFYFTHFTETLAKIGFNGPKPKIMEMHEQIRRLKNVEVFILVACLPMRYALTEGIFDPDKMVSSAEYRKNLYRNEAYIKELHELLPIYLSDGYLEK